MRNIEKLSIRIAEPVAGLQTIGNPLKRGARSRQPDREPDPAHLHRSRVGCAAPRASCARQNEQRTKNQPGGALPPLGLLQHCFVRSESSRTSRRHFHAGGSTVCLAGARLRKRHETFPTRRGGHVVPDAVPILPITFIEGQLSTRVESVIVEAPSVCGQRRSWTRVVPVIGHNGVASKRRHP